MEFVSRKTCIEHYESQFPNLPRYMIEMALDYDLAQGGSSNEKPATGKEKRKAKKAAKEREPIKREVNELIKHAMATATPLEMWASHQGRELHAATQNARVCQHRRR